MIKHLFTTLCALALITAGSIPALAAEADTSESARYYPISVEEYTYEEQNEPRINKVYQLSLSDNPSGIPTKDFVRNGRLYYLLDMTRKDEVGVDTKPHTETVTPPRPPSHPAARLPGPEAELERTTEEGYTGVLRLDHTSVQVTTDGYATKTQPLSATRSYPNLSEADLSLIPKSIEEKGKTLTLADVQWSSSEQTDGAGGTVTANYTGEVAKTGCSVVTYTAIFGSMEAPEESTEPESGNSTASAGVDLSTLKMPLLVGGVVVILAAGGVFVFKKLKERR